MCKCDTDKSSYWQINTYILLEDSIKTQFKQTNKPPQQQQQEKLG